LSKLHIVSMIVLALAVHSAAVAQKASREGIQQQREIDTFVKRTAAHGKVALLYFTSPHCPPCRLLEAQFFPDPAITRALGAKYQVLKLDGDVAMAGGIYSRYGLKTGYPNFVALGADGKPLDRYLGAALEPPKGHGMTINKRAMLEILLRLAAPKDATATR
jgi:thiol-disulfide isomerase/thioredoxin